LRPGEKLHEELWEAGSIREPAGSDEVFRVSEPSGIEAGRLSAKVDEVVAAAARGDALSIHKTLSEIIPNFVSSLHLPGQPMVTDGTPSGRGRMS
jgi:FlaA1/EpsC-like NDP-sugar epimerase